MTVKTIQLLTSSCDNIPVGVEGVSMLPTYKGRGVNFINRLAFVFHEPRRGDVVDVLHPP
jgi:signal peptidase I